MLSILSCLTSKGGKILRKTLIPVMIYNDMRKSECDLVKKFKQISMGWGFEQSCSISLKMQNTIGVNSYLPEQTPYVMFFDKKGQMHNEFTLKFPYTENLKQIFSRVRSKGRYGC